MFLCVVLLLSSQKHFNARCIVNVNLILWLYQCFSLVHVLFDSYLVFACRLFCCFCYTYCSYEILAFFFMNICLNIYLHGFLIVQ